MSKVGDIMITEVNPVSPSTPVIEVAHQMNISERDIIPVCDQGKFRGIITERDIVVGIVATATDPVTEPTSSVMNEHCPTTSPDAEIMEAAKVMMNKGAHILPVVRNGELLGLLSLDDLARESPALAAMVFSKTIELQVSKKAKAG